MTKEALRLKEYRTILNLSQKDLAEVLGVKQDLISRYENGAYTIPLDIVKQLYLKYKMSYVWFFHGIGKPKLDEISKATITTDLKEVLLENNLLKEKIKYIEKELNTLTSRLERMELTLHV